MTVVTLFGVTGILCRRIERILSVNKGSQWSVDPYSLSMEIFFYADVSVFSFDVFVFSFGGLLSVTICFVCLFSLGCLCFLFSHAARL